MNRKFLTLILILSTFACGRGYNKVLKSNNLEYKYGKAVEYYKNGECIKAIPIFEELISLYRGTSRSEKIFYYYAQSQYCLKDYILAGYYFKQFTTTFPNSGYVEECAYMAAHCSFLESPGFSLDSAPTRTALVEMQLFLDLYPNTSRKDSINSIIDVMNEKLERKSFETSKLYLKTEKYKSAVIALKNTLREYPASQYRHDIMFMIIEANYQYAINSVDSKKQERLEDTVDSYLKFVDNFESSERLQEAETFFSSAQKQLEAYK